MQNTKTYQNHQKKKNVEINYDARCKVILLGGGTGWKILRVLSTVLHGYEALWTVGVRYFTVIVHSYEITPRIYNCV